MNIKKKNACRTFLLSIKRCLEPIFMDNDFKYFSLESELLRVQNIQNVIPLYLKGYHLMV